MAVLSVIITAVRIRLLAPKASWALGEIVGICRFLPACFREVRVLWKRALHRSSAEAVLSPKDRRRQDARTAAGQK